MKFSIAFPLAISCLFSLQAQNESQTGIQVVRADSGWFLGGRKVKLKPGEPLPAKAELNGTQAAPLILACTADLWLAYACKTATCRVIACSTSVDGVIIHQIHLKREPLEQTAGPASPLSSLLRRQRKDAETLGVRGGGNPNDAVVRQSGDAVHWGPALTRVLEGRYCFRLTPLPEGDARTFTLEWDRTAESEGIAKAPGLPAGVYSLEKGDAACRFDNPDAAAAWVLIASEARFAQVDAAWKAYAPSFNDLAQTGANPAVVATARRAVLSSLGDSLDKK